jgi:hypothetical protein
VRAGGRFAASLIQVRNFGGMRILLCAVRAISAHRSVGRAISKDFARIAQHPSTIDCEGCQFHLDDELWPDGRGTAHVRGHLETRHAAVKFLVPRPMSRRLQS